MAKVSAEIKGLTQTLQRLNAMPGKKTDGVMGGLLAGGLVVQRAAMKLTPVEFGFLRASAFTRKAQDGKLAVEVGYTAAYARFVHRAKERHRGERRKSGIGTYWNPGERLFLTKAFRQNLPRIIVLVKKGLKGGKK